MSARPKSLPCSFFYDAVGSRLFEEVCDLSEYYLTRTEDSILRENAAAMLDAWHGAPVLIELGSGSSAKTRRLISAALDRFGELHYVPIDVSSTILEDSARALARNFPGLQVTGYAADYRHALAHLAGRIPHPRCYVFLGSSLGNYEANQAVGLLRHIARSMRPEDRLLLGTDLVKDARTLEAAYDDRKGITARFNLNLLERINRELGADFNLDNYMHKAFYREVLSRVEMHLVSRVAQSVRIPAIGLTVAFEGGESIHTENSHKYRRETLLELAKASGFTEEAAWTDRDRLFRVQRWRLSAHM